MSHDRPVDRDELESDEDERIAAYTWAMETIRDPKRGEEFAIYIEDVEGGSEALAEALALRCWPKQTTLVPTSARWFYRQQVGDIPFVPLAAHLQQYEKPKYGGLEVAAFLDRWLRHHSNELDGGWHVRKFRTELRGERQRLKIADLTRVHIPLV